MKVNNSDHQIKNINNYKSNAKLTAIRSKNIIHSSSSLIPFPKENDMFYKENKVLWESTIVHLKEEKRMMNKANKTTAKNNTVFRKSNIFSLSSFLVSNPISPKHNPNRIRDYHSDYNCITKAKQSNSIQVKTLSPLHYKLYESLLQEDDCIKKQKAPQSYPNYKKKEFKACPTYSLSRNAKIESYKSHFCIS